jgi:hypothetical protein
MRNAAGNGTGTLLAGRKILNLYVDLLHFFLVTLERIQRCFKNPRKPISGSLTRICSGEHANTGTGNTLSTVYIHKSLISLNYR